MEGSTVGSGALQDLQRAIEAYDDYNGSRTQYIESRDDLLDAVEARLIELGDPDDASMAPGEIDEQWLLVQNAQEEINLNRIAVENLNAEIGIETQRVAEQVANDISIADIKVSYFEKQRALDQEIADIELTHDLARGIAPNITSPDEWVGFGVGLIVDASEKYQTDKLYEMKDQLAAGEIMDVAIAGAGGREIDLAAFIKTRLLSLKSLAVQSIIAANNAGIATSRMRALLAEKSRLENRRNSFAESLQNRYYADPIHQLRATDSIGRARLSFKRAQLWSFALMRSLEYKWSEPFAYSGYTEADLFSARNARDLNDVILAMRDYDTAKSDYYDIDPEPFTFSFRRDVCGLEDDRSDPAYDGDTTIFREKLADFYDANSRSFIIQFDTVKQFDGSSFFRGPIFNADGTLPTNRRGNAVDKIQSTQVHFVGDFNDSLTDSGQPGRDRLGEQTLSYGGTNFLRKLEPGTFDFANDRPELLVDELIAYQTRHYDTSNFPPAESRSTLDDKIQIQLNDTSLPNFPINTDPDTSTVASTRFNDRSVATTDWKLYVDLGSGSYSEIFDDIDDIWIIFNHRFIGR